MPKINSRIVGPALVATGPTTVYTVPASTRAVIRRIHVYNPSGSAVTFTMSIGADAAATRIYDARSIAAAAAGVTTNQLDDYGPYSLEAATTIQVAAGTNNVLNIVIDADLHTV
jgi:hypothetical protein